MILQAIANYVSNETGREVSVTDINLSQEKISADVNIGAPADKTEKPKSTRKSAKAEPEADKEIGIVDEALDQGPEETTEEVVEDKAEEPNTKTPEKELVPERPRNGSIFNFASEG